jgi:hypothetical protein
MDYQKLSVSHLGKLVDNISIQSYIQNKYSIGVNQLDTM